MATSGVQLLHLRSAQQLRDVAAAWDDLWQRSAVTLPTARASMVVHWVERLAPERPFHALAVERDGRLLAALPLIETRLKSVLRSAVCRATSGRGLATCCWKKNLRRMCSIV